MSNAAEPRYETLGERVKRLREALKLNQADLAKAAGVTPSAISQLESGNTKGLKPENLIAVANRLEVTPEELVTGQRPLRRHASSIRNVPIIGFVIADPERDGFFDDMGYPPGGGEVYVPWPTRDVNAYGLRVRGDSMQPRIRPGELLIVEPNVHAAPGSDVVVRTRDGRKMVKQLLFRRGGEVTLGSVNVTHKQITISLAEIESMHTVAAIVPAGSAKHGEG